MKKLSLLVLMLIGITGFAQQHDRMDHSKGEKMTAEEKAAKMTERLTKQLDLTAEQQAQIKALYLEKAQKQDEMMAQRKDKMKDAKEKMKDRKEKMREKMMAERKENMEQLKAILSEDQFNKFRQIQKERQEKMHGHSRDWVNDNDKSGN